MMMMMMDVTVRDTSRGVEDRAQRVAEHLSEMAGYWW
jgi:hypothetical protein